MPWLLLSATSGDTVRRYEPVPLQLSSANEVPQMWNKPLTFSMVCPLFDVEKSCP